MAHRLEPPDESKYLQCSEVIARLRDEFAYCDADRDQGSNDVGDMIVKLIELKAPQEIIDNAIAGRENSYHVTIADDPYSENYLSFMLRPNTGLLIGYHSLGHQENTQTLLDRCAKTLGYMIHVV